MTVKVASIQEMRQIEAAADRSVMSYEQMMLNAGQAASDYLQARYPISAGAKITFLIGKGNNGGDGLVMAHALSRATDADITLYLLEQRGLADLNYRAALADGISVSLAGDDAEGQSLTELVKSADIIVDAVFGIGLRLPLRDDAAIILATVNSSLVQRSLACAAKNTLYLTDAAPKDAAKAPFILAIDCPSGIDGDSGQADSNAISADATISFTRGQTRASSPFPPPATSES